MSAKCPLCGSHDSQQIYQAASVPVHSVRLLWNEMEARNLPKGNITLQYCLNCGFLWNRDFQPELQDYSINYESTQAFSNTFNAFSTKLANELISRNHLHRKTILEIGCGQGEFLQLLCTLGENKGIGFDPAYDPDRSLIRDNQNIEMIPDLYSDKYSHYKADFVICKMTLEHIPNVDEFISILRRAIGDQYKTKVFFQIPNMDRIVAECAFWDIYYEHCSYFHAGSLTYLFEKNGFQTVNVWSDYGNQYLMIEAVPSDPEKNSSAQNKQPTKYNHETIMNFSREILKTISNWGQLIQSIESQGKKVVLWGGGSKAVAFLNTIESGYLVRYAVDVNPRKEGSFLPGLAQRVVGPDFLKTFKPDVVVLMNPLYRKEIQEILERFDIKATIMSVGDDKWI
jgi:hypothetical protein